MKTRFVTPEYDSTISAVILSANDVIATVLILEENEGYFPKTIADVHLPFEARNYRKQSVDGKSMFQRGDIINIRCRVEKTYDKLSESDILNMIGDFYDLDDDNAELYDGINERAKKFVLEWDAICKKDFEKVGVGGGNK